MAGKMDLDYDVTATARAEWPLLAATMTAQPGGRRRAMLALIVQHMVGEYVGDTPMVMDTLDSDPHYQYLGQAMGPAPVGWDGVEAGYNRSAGTNRNMRIDRVLLDDDLVVTEGDLLVAVSGDNLRQMGVTLPEGADPRVPHVARIRLAIFWPFTAAGKLAGEEIYFGSKPGYLRLLEPGERLFGGPVRP
jgi:hypothetical protein